MQHSEFRIGSVFRCGDKRWRCIDVGSRVIVAIYLDPDDDPSWYNGPPYALDESVFDEDDTPTKFQPHLRRDRHFSQNSRNLYKPPSPGPSFCDFARFVEMMGRAKVA